MLVIRRIGNRSGEVADMPAEVALLGIEQGKLDKLEGEQLLQFLQARNNGDTLPTFPAEARPPAVETATAVKIQGRRSRRKRV